MTVIVKDKTPLVVPPAVRRRASLKRNLQYYPTCAETLAKYPGSAPAVFASPRKHGNGISADCCRRAIRLFLQVPLKSGQAFEFKVSGVVIGIRPKLRAADEEYTPKQRRIVDAQLAESLAEIAAGRVRGPFATHREFISSLHQEARKLNHRKTKRSA